MVIITAMTFSPLGPLIQTPILAGVTCQDRPKRSFSQPHWDSLPPPVIRPSQ
jgi:hypothetical protein